MSIAKTEAALEATRQKIAKQLSMVGRSIQSIDPTLYDKEQELERLLKHLQEVRDAPTRSQKVLLVNEFENKREHWNACKHAEIEDVVMNDDDFIDEIRVIAFGESETRHDYSLKEICHVILERSNEHYHLSELQVLNTCETCGQVSDRWKYVDGELVDTKEEWAS